MVRVLGTDEEGPDQMTTDQPTAKLAAVAITAAVFATGCTLAIDRNDVQCTVDADCAVFGGHPVCQGSVCVATGLGPPGCFLGEPTSQEEFANRCSTSQTFQFDNCARLGLCDDGSLSAAWASAVPPSGIGSGAAGGTQPVPVTNCADAGPNLIYVTGSTNLPPLLKAVQPLLSAGTPPYTVVFAPQTSCKGAAAAFDVSPSKHVISNVVNNAAFYYNAAGAQVLCLLNPAGDTVDVGESDVYPSTCGYAATANVSDYPGPIQAITFVVPSASKQIAISAEAAHLVFSSGGASGRAAPWTDPRYFFVRSSGTGTTQIPSRAIGLDPTMWWGIDRVSAGNLVTQMESIDPNLTEDAIGVLSSDFADRSRANLRVLAFQQRGQHYAYLPDSNPDASDKANVRDGHYPIWGAIHFMAATSNGVPSAAASALITQFYVPKLEQSLVSAIVEAGFVPPCAMTVTHTAEVGPLTAFQPKFACGCFYDKIVSTTTTCKACEGPADCPSTAPACNYGYCELQ